LRALPPLVLRCSSGGSRTPGRTRNIPGRRFLRHGGIYQSDVGFFFSKLGPGCRLHDPEPKLAGNPFRGQDYLPPGPRSRRARTKLQDVKERTPNPIVSMSSGRLFLDRVARQQSPSPLHRHAQNITHFPEAGSKGDISTLRGRGHFYFALTDNRSRLTRSEALCIVLGE
jgi:hypothetical protein